MPVHGLGHERARYRFTLPEFPSQGLGAGTPGNMLVDPDHFQDRYKLLFFRG
jgi:hypothetical protein